MNDLVLPQPRCVVGSGYGLFSLWDIMQRFEPSGLMLLIEAYFRAIRILGATEQARVARQSYIGPVKIVWDFTAQQANDSVSEFVTQLQEVSRALDLTGVIENLDGVEGNLPQTVQHADFLMTMFIRELGQRRYLRLSVDKARFFETDKLLTDAVKESFRDSVPSEIRAAGTAYACGLPNACVFHSMRAAEIGLRIIADKLGVSLTGDENLKNVIDGIKKAAVKLEEGPKVAGKSATGKFYGELAIDAGHFKDAWRNYVAHAKADFREPQALSILTSTIHFFEVIAERFSQDDLPPTQPEVS